MSSGHVPPVQTVRTSHRRRTRSTHDYDAYTQGLDGAEGVAYQDAIDGSYGEQNITPGALTIAKYARTIRPVAIVDALPDLPNDDYPQLSYAVLTTDDRLYKNIGDVWVLGVDGADIVADSITAGQIAAGAISATEIAAGAITSEKLAIGAFGLSLLKNGNFEEGIDSAYGTASTQAPGWTARGDTEFRLLVDGDALSGTHIVAFKSIAGVSSPGINQNLDAVPGRTYRLSGWVWKEVAAGAGLRLRLNTLDSAGSVVAFDQISLHNSTTATPTYVEGTFTIPSDGSVSGIRVELVSTATPAASEIFYAEDVTLELIPAGARNTSGSVVIDEDGIVIKDEFSEASLTAAGFGGSWSDFVANGLYNSRLKNTGASIPAGRTAALPYWTMFQFVGSPTMSGVSGGGVEIAFAAVNNGIRLTSDRFSVVGFGVYALEAITEAVLVSATPTFTMTVRVKWYDEAGTLLLNSTVDTHAWSAGVGSSRNNHHWDPVIAHGDAVTAEVVIEVVESVGHDGSARIYLYQVGVHRIASKAETLIVEDTFSVNGQSNQNDITAADIDAISVSATMIATGHTRLASLISPTAIAANTDNWNPTDLDIANIIRIGSDATPRNLTGIVAQPAGTMIWLHNRNNATVITLVHDATSTAANRFYCPGAANYALAGKDSVLIVYSSTDSRWLVLG